MYHHKGNCFTEANMKRSHQKFGTGGLRIALVVLFSFLIGAAVLLLFPFGAKNSFVASAAPVEVSGIRAIYVDDPEKPVYTTTPLDQISGIYVYPVYNNGTEGEYFTDSSQYTVSGTLYGAGYQTLTITHVDEMNRTHTATIKVFVTVPVVEKIEAAFNLPAGSYIYETTPLDNLKEYTTVTAYWSDKKTTSVNKVGYTLTGSLSSGISNVVVSFDNVSTTMNVEVSPIEFQSFQPITFPSDVEVFSSWDLDRLREYITPTVTFSNGDKYELKPEEYELSGTLEAGLSKITVRYYRKGIPYDTDFIVTVKAQEQSAIRAVYTASSRINIYSSMPLEELRKWLQVTVEYNDGMIEENYTDYAIGGILEAGKYSKLNITSNQSACQCTVELYVFEWTLNSISARAKEGATLYQTASLEDVKSILLLSANITRNGVTQSLSVTGENLDTAQFSYDFSNLIYRSGRAYATVSVTYNGKTDLVEVTVLEVVVSELTVSIDLGEKQIYTVTPIDDLRSYLTVTAKYNDGKERVLASNEYQLKGSFMAGVTPVTVSFGNATATVSVPVTYRGELNVTDKSVVVSGIEFADKTLVVERVSYDILSKIPVGNEKLAVQGFDIELHGEEGAVQPDGKVTVRLLLDEAQRDKKLVKVYYVADDGTLEDMNAVKNGDYLQFNTNHFSRYIVVVDTSESATSRNDIVLIAICVILALVIEFVIFFIVLKSFRKPKAKKRANARNAANRSNDRYLD